MGVGFVIKKLLGVLALGMGLLIVAWVIFNQFAPTKEYERSFRSVFQFLFPVVMIWQGWRWLTAKPDNHDVSRGKEREYPHFVFARILDPVGPMDRGSRYEDPLNEALQMRGLGEVSGGGTQLSKEGGIEWVGLDLELANLQEAL